MFTKVFKFYPRMIAMKMIRFYQRTLSFDHGVMKDAFPGGFCRYHPTCSEYTYQAIQKYGVMRGSLMGMWRILRCNPFSHGGDDPVK